VAGVKRPAGLHYPAQSVSSVRGPAARRIPVVPPGRYVHAMTVDIGNDGMAPVATFNGSGQAWAAIGPSGLGQSWAADQASAWTSVGPLDAAQVAFYVGPYMTPFLPIATYQQVSSLSGGGAQFGLGGVGIPDGWFVSAFWTGGTSGALAYLRVTGLKTVLTA
jgi:hypothetical protein